MSREVEQQIHQVTEELIQNQQVTATMEPAMTAWRDSLEEAWMTVGIPSLQPPECSSNDENSLQQFVAVSVTGLQCGSNVIAWRRPCGGYTMPGGKLQENDTNILHCASRETREECGINIAPENWEVLGTSTLSVPGKTFVLVLCTTSLASYPANIDPESLGMEVLDLFSPFTPLAGNESLFQLMRDKFLQERVVEDARQQA